MFNTRGFEATFEMDTESSQTFFDWLHEQDKEWIDALLNGEQGMTLCCGDGRSVKLVPEKTGKWIPVSERLPKETGIYLVTLKTDGVAYFEDEFPNGFVYASAYEAVTMRWGYCDKNVIAWMPLPEPYRSEK